MSVTFKTNHDAVIAQLKAAKQAARTGPPLKAGVFTIVGYAPFVEYGTVRMEPRAMVRNSLPNIRSFFLKRMSRVDPFNRQSLVEALNDVAAFAQAQIRMRTPVRTGNLIQSWTVRVAR